MANAAAVPIPSQLERPAPGFASRVFGFLATLARRKPMGFAGLLVIVVMVAIAIAPQLFDKHDPGKIVGDRHASYCFGPQDSFLCPVKTEAGLTVAGVEVTKGQTLTGSTSTPLGTDTLGRDVYSRLIWGTRVAVQVGFGAVVLSSFVALAIGVSSGYFRGMFDSVVQRFVDAVMAFPPLVVLLALPNMIGGATVWKLVMILGILGGVGGSRVIRAAVLGMSSAQFIEAARTIGATDLRIMARHVVPNIFGPLMVQATIGLGGTILAESALSFLGLGITQNDRPTWGYMLNLGQRVAIDHPWQAIWPGLAIAIAVFSFNMFGDALRDLLDPRLRGARGSFA
ncbi:MAG: ABC transporter permease [Dehalococcoidia bacterium]